MNNEQMTDARVNTLLRDMGKIVRRDDGEPVWLDPVDAAYIADRLRGGAVAVDYAVILDAVNEASPRWGDAPDSPTHKLAIRERERIAGRVFAALAQDRASQGAVAGGVAEEWRDLVQSLVDHIESETCLHEHTHRSGAIWEICDDCGCQWADDRGGRPEFNWPKPVERAHAMLADQQGVRSDV